MVYITIFNIKMRNDTIHKTVKLLKYIITYCSDETKETDERHGTL